MSGMASRDNVGPGWQPLLDELEAQLEATGVPYTVVQIKEKFGGLRYYVQADRLASKDDTEFYKAIFDAEEKSLTICEDCGEPGTPAAARYWIRTLCEGCRA